MVINEYFLLIFVEEISEILEEYTLEGFSKIFFNEITDMLAVIEMINDKNILNVKLPVSTINDLNNENFLSIKSNKKLLVKNLFKLQYFVLKGMRFGINDKKDENSLKNEDQIKYYLNNFLFYLNNFINNNNQNITRNYIYNEKKIKKKKEKVLKFMELSIKNGTLIIEK